MSPADQAAVGVTRVLWRGRRTEFGGLDGWNCDRATLLKLLRTAGELVVLDSLSFPWESLLPSHREIPLVVRLPAELDAAAIDLVLREPLRERLTPFDRLIEARTDVREQLTTLWQLDPSTWLVPEEGESDVAALRQHSLRQLQAVRTDIGSFVAPPGDLVTRHLVEFGAHQRGTLNVLLALIEPGDVVCDVGAHIGTFAVPVAALAKATVVAIEGHPRTAAILSENIADNDLTGQVTVLNRVLSDRSGVAVAPALVPGNSGATSFSPATGLPESQSTVTLDSLLDSVPQLAGTSVLKLDCEGAEVAVLTGGRTLLTSCRPVIVVEVAAELLEAQGGSVAELETMLRDLGYRFWHVLGERNTDAKTWSISPVDHLTDVSERLFEIVAEPPGSDRVSRLGLEGSL